MEEKQTGDGRLSAREAANKIAFSAISNTVNR
jgi:hypothetical protein